MPDQNDTSAAPHLLYGIVHNAASQQQRGLVASSNEQPIVPRILSSSSRISHSQDTSAASYENSSANDLSSIVASSSFTSNEESEAPDPAIVDALRNAKERLFVLKLGENMENIIDQRRRVCPLFFLSVVAKPSPETHLSSSHRRHLTKGCWCTDVPLITDFNLRQMVLIKRYLFR